MSDIIWTTKRPKEEGYYILNRTQVLLATPHLVQVRLDGGKLWILGDGVGSFPLARLAREKGVKFSQKLNLKEKTNA